MNMNTNTSKCETLPKLMNSTHKLLEPVYIKNTQLKQQLQESRFLPQIKNQVMSPNSKQMVIQRLIHSLDYSARNFGSACDRGFQALSNFHQSQKFGHSSIRLQPLQRELVVDITDREDAEVIPKDDRTYFKKIQRVKDFPILVMIKSFEIDFVREFDDEPDKKNSKLLGFSTALQIYNSHQDPINFFTKHLQLLERNSVSIKQKGLDSLSKTVKDFSEQPQQRMISIKNSNGYFKINYPIAQLYVQEHQHTQTLELSPFELYELVKNNFADVQYLANQFDMEKFKLYQQDQDEIRSGLLSQNMSMEMRQSQQKLGSQHQSKRGSIKSLNEQYFKKSVESLSILILQGKSKKEDHIQQKRIIKKVVRYDDLFYLVKFVPIQFVLKKKSEDKIVHLYTPTISEYINFLCLNKTRHTKDMLEDFVQLKQNISDEAFDYKEFKEGLKICFDPPHCGVIKQVTEDHKKNGMLDTTQKEFKINNKEFTLSYEPATFIIYEQRNCYIEKRKSTMKELNLIFDLKFNLEFQLVDPQAPQEVKQKDSKLRDEQKKKEKEQQIVIDLKDKEIKSPSYKQEQQIDKKASQEAIKIEQKEEQQEQQEDKKEDQVSPQQQKQEQLQSGNALSHLGLKIVEEQINIPDQIWKKKLIKKVVRHEDSFYTVNFIPIKIILKEKVSQKLIHTYNPNFSEMMNFLCLSQHQKVSKMLEDQVALDINLDPMAFDYSEFKKGIKVTMTFPTCGTVEEVTDDHLQNGLFEECIREQEVNNKMLQIIFMPSYIDIYEQKQCAIDKRRCEVADLNIALKYKFMIGFRIC